MNTDSIAWVVAVAALCAIVFKLWRFRRRKLTQLERRRAIGEFESRRDSLEATFLLAANATGKPRGLRWVACRLGPAVAFAVDEQSEELVALAPATISFEAIEGGAMEGVEAVGNLRTATAVFVLRGGQWVTDGRAVFNLEPPEAIERLGGRLQPVAGD